ncbi:PREDICTED: fructose-bisphosphate aldolase-like isoform X2 [Cyphomyrmex costatus]|uniref:fructose-bisphosphate aldolase-like isoform X2 n=1 Tax=Cyphomyrmex costatus TaxID=456900 RepID=UPI000852296F|nr:PREDICTED: fructose-bisphosphate aldolase-like isoform X2 [Cyphomyrmex costatus]
MMQLENGYCDDKISSKLESALCLELQKIVKSISAPGKGLLACDESPSNLEERFQEIGINNTESTRRAYREMLLSADKSQFSQYISGVILHHEMIHQRTSEDVEFIEFLRRRNIVAGVKVDRGLVHLFNTEDEKITLGLDNLQENCVRYKQEGCHLAEWKCVFSISERCPSQLAMIANANVLARFASICQRTRMVPIVEPEILNNGEYDIDRALQVHEEMLSILFRALNEYHVYLEGMVLKLAMVLSGIKNAIKCTPQIVAEYTLRALRRTVPMAVPAIFFLNGDQTDEEAVLNLNAINACDNKIPWRLSFCYGRALQNTVIKIWKNNPENVDKAQAMFLKRVKLCSEASLGKLRVQDNNSLCELNRFNFLSL